MTRFTLSINTQAESGGLNLNAQVDADSIIDAIDLGATGLKAAIVSSGLTKSAAPPAAAAPDAAPAPASQP